MIKRTAEKILTWIGVGIQTIAILFCGFLALVIGLNSNEIETALLEDGTYTVDEAQFVVMIYNFFINFAVIFGILALILAIVGGVFINKKTKLAGILLIIAGVLSFFFSLSGILWLVAGIMLLVRKPAPTHAQSMQNNNQPVNHSEPQHVENHNPVRHSEQRSANSHSEQAHTSHHTKQHDDEHFRSEAEEQRSKDIQKDPYKY
ncbi:DUF4064 domain-containing protein [Staphylococcus agnetis]|uniref:DUF4064 domain-containing protein n=1 Tax=Staphylococcus agnetis TaxID=985762 RepID=UPI0021D37117|nr:DUF4064 domain-containing protein [Staphylococcus agnetis]UXU59725.1 DUF4064 domain-containing protein [Staphylococcus agnetis]UXU62054.1 DUF4064 domain-containing protein [Staphylococcus agnetis]